MPSNDYSSNTNHTYIPNHSTVDLGNQTASRVGNHVNSRMVFNVEDESGKVTKGFFTENIKQDINDEIKQYVNRFITDDQKNEYGDFIENFIQNFNIDNFKSYFDEVSILSPDDGYSLFENIKEESKKNILDKCKRYLNIPEKVLDECIPGGISNDEYKKENIYSGENRFLSFLEDLTSVINTKIIGLNSTRDDLKQEGYNTYLNYRNNAMSEYAELLDIPDSVAKSVSMSVINNGKVIHGSFMEEADGILVSDIKKRAIQMSGNEAFNTLGITGSAIRDISKLQILDYLCGNIDRHQDNMLYNYEIIDGKPFITGVQGIDNDTSFANVKGIKNYCYMSGLEDINVIDKDLAANLLSITDEQLEKTILPYGLSKNEFAAAQTRLRNLQEAIKLKLNNSENLKNTGDSKNEKTNNPIIDCASKIKIISAKEEWDEITSPETYKQLFTSKNKNNRDEIKKNIFYMLKTVTDIYKITLSNTKKNEVTEQEEEKVFIPTAKRININERISLMDYSDNLKRMYKAINSVKTEDAQKSEFCNALNSLVDKLEKMCNGDNGILSNKYPESMTDMQRNYIRQSFKDFIGIANNCIEKSPKNSTELIHEFKSCKIFCDKAEEGISRDALEAEKSLMQKLVNDVEYKSGQYVPVHTDKPNPGKESDKDYDFLEKWLNKVDSPFIGSSDRFKEMVKAFKSVHDTNDLNPLQKQAAYNFVADKAKLYLEAKELESNPSDYAKNRMAFARELINFGKVNAHKSNPVDQQQEDIINVMMFKNRCRIMVDKLGNNPDEKKQRAVLNDRDNFVKGFTDVLEISSRYASTHPMQGMCMDALSDKNVDLFEKKYNEFSNNIYNKQSKDFIESMGLKSEYRNTVEYIKEIGAEQKALIDKKLNMISDNKSKQNSKTLSKSKQNEPNRIDPKKVDPRQIETLHRP